MVVRVAPWPSEWCPHEERLESSLPPPPPPCDNPTEVCKLGGGPHQTPDCSHLDHGLPASRAVRNTFAV